MTNLVLTAIVTAYVATGNPCSDGKMPKVGLTCAAPRSIPKGTWVHIEGVGYRLVQDRTAKKYDGRFDVFMSSRKEALKFGKQTLRVTIYRERENNIIVK